VVLHEELSPLEIQYHIRLVYYYSRSPLIWMLVIHITNYLYWLGLLGQFVENSTKLTCLEITGYWIKYNTVL